MDIKYGGLWWREKISWKYLIAFRNHRNKAVQPVLPQLRTWTNKQTNKQPVWNVMMMIMMIMTMIVIRWKLVVACATFYSSFIFTRDPYLINGSYRIILNLHYRKVDLFENYSILLILENIRNSLSTKASNYLLFEYKSVPELSMLPTVPSIGFCLFFLVKLICTKLTFLQILCFFHSEKVRFCNALL